MYITSALSAIAKFAQELNINSKKMSEISYGVSVQWNIMQPSRRMNHLYIYWCGTISKMYHSVKKKDID